MRATALALGPWLLLAVCALRWLVPPWTLNHDVGWFLHVAGRWLDGARPYVDVVDLNPPLITYLMALPVAAGRALGISAELALHLFVLGLAAAALGLVQAALRRLGALDPPRRALWLGAVVYVLLVAPAADTGQREHLLTALALPWVVLAAARTQRLAVASALALPAGALAGVGFALKPHFALAPALVLLWQLRRGGRRAALAPENLALLAVLALYAAHFALLPQDVRAGLARTAELAAATYEAYDMPLRALLGEPPLVEAALLGAALLYLPPPGPARDLAASLGLVWLALLAAALWQHKGWSYHLLAPASAGRLLLAAVGLALLARRPALSALVACGLLLLTASALVERHGGALRWEKPGRAHLEHAAQLRALAGGGPVLVLDTDLAPHFPALVHAGLEPTSRLACLWPVPGLVRWPRPDLERALRDQLVADCRARPPRLIVLREPPVLNMDPGFDLLAWLRRDPRFAELWARYEPVGRSDGLAFHRRRG